MFAIFTKRAGGPIMYEYIASKAVKKYLEYKHRQLITPKKNWNSAMHISYSKSMMKYCISISQL